LNNFNAISKEDNNMKTIQEIKEATSKFNSSLYEGLTIDDAIEYANVIARDLQKVKTHQLRRFFSAIKNIQNKVVDLKDNDLFPAGEYAETSTCKCCGAFTRIRKDRYAKFVRHFTACYQDCKKE